MNKFNKKYIIISIVIMIVASLFFNLKQNNEKDSNGERYPTMNNPIAQFGINPANETQTITFNSEPDTITPSTRAGSYSGQLYFSVVCE